MVTLPTIECYGNYQNGNYGVNAMRVTVGPLSIWYSYRTPVAFALNGRRWVRENDWGPTTGKHLNAIDGGNRADRISSGAFEHAWTNNVEPLLNA